MQRATSTEARTRPEPSQRQLLGLILASAGEDSAGFGLAVTTVAAATGLSEPQPLTRELLTDLVIRGWIELRIEDLEGAELPLPRIRSEAQFADPRNWGEPGSGPRTRFRVTEKGRAQLGRLLPRP